MMTLNISPKQNMEHDGCSFGTASPLFPFTAFFGADHVKEALLLVLINPKIGGVLVDGAHGTGKSVLVRSLRELVPEAFVELPSGATEEMLTGSLDFEKTVTEGRPVYEQGLLYRADSAYVCADNAALLAEGVAERLVHALSAKEYEYTEAGKTFAVPCHFALFGTADLRDDALRPGLLDAFGLYAKIDGSENLKERVEILKRCSAFARDPEEFLENEKARMNAVRRGIREARERLISISPDERILRKIADKTLEAGVQGHTADLIMMETVRAVAAFRGRCSIIDSDVDEAAYFVLPHRMRTAIPEEKAEQEPPEEEEQEAPDETDRPDESDPEEPPEEENGEQEEKEQDDTPPPDRDTDSSEEWFRDIPRVFGTAEGYEAFAFSHREDRKARSGSGKRTKTRTEARSGRYLFPTMHRRNDDIALDATIRAAAPFQKIRKKEIERNNGVRNGREKAVEIRNEDIREKVREKRISNLLVFVVDASGSMGAARRMSEAKGAVLSLLKDAYVKRDQVAMVTFGGDGVNVILPPTRSAERGYRCLSEIKTGGKTPLNEGISKGLQVIRNQLRLRPDQLPLLIIITDGKGNLPIEKGKKPKEELLGIAEKMAKIKAVETMIIDTERRGLMSLGIALRLAQTLGASYYRLEDMKDGELGEVVRKEIRAK